MTPPPVWAVLGFDGPVYLRKLPRKNVLGDPTTPLDPRAAEVAAAVFLYDPGPFSLFLVASDDDLGRVAVGYNGGRASLTADLDWLPIRPAELVAAGGTVRQTVGDTRCHYTNARHYDLTAGSPELERLCRYLLEANRAVLSMRKNQFRPWVERATADGCRVVPASAGCRAAGCDPV